MNNLFKLAPPVLALLAVAHVSQALAADIPLVGLDDDGNPIEVTIASHDYTKQMQAIVSTVNDSALAALESNANASPWKLHTVVVGIGVGLEAGIGPVIKVKTTPRFRMAFADNADPALP